MQESTTTRTILGDAVFLEEGLTILYIVYLTTDIVDAAVIEQEVDESFNTSFTLFETLFETPCRGFM